LVPESGPQLGGTPVFIGAGRHDQIVSAARTAQLARLLESAGAKVTVHVEPAGHPLTDDDVAAARAWLAPHLALLA